MSRGGRPKWDSYGSWGGLLPFSRDRIHEGSIEAASLRGILNLWGKSGRRREVLEQLALPPDILRREAPPYTLASHVRGSPILDSSKDRMHSGCTSPERHASGALRFSSTLRTPQPPGPTLYEEKRNTRASSVT